jgi:hypothetical protein
MAVLGGTAALRTLEQDRIKAAQEAQQEGVTAL